MRHRERGHKRARQQQRRVRQVGCAWACPSDVSGVLGAARDIVLIRGGDELSQGPGAAGACATGHEAARGAGRLAKWIDNGASDT
ncbi:MAG: hypothetical protein AB1762_03950 [Gemmatimonadota bacterium]